MHGGRVTSIRFGPGRLTFIRPDGPLPQAQLDEQARPHDDLVGAYFLDGEPVEQVGGQYLFDPDSPMPRDEFLAMCTRLTGTSMLQGVLSTGFGDDEQIPAWAKTYVATAVMNGDIAGCSNGTAIVFDAQRGITAAEAAVMLSNFLGPSPTAALESENIPDWACAAVSSLTSCGVYPDGSDCAASITRAEAAQMLLGAYELLQKR